MSKKYKVSQWCHSFLRDDVAAIFHSVTMELAFFSSEVGTKLIGLKKQPLSQSQILSHAGIDNETFRSLQKIGLIVPAGDDERKYLSKVREKLLAEISLDAMYLLVSDACNLCCSYCSEEVMDLHQRFSARNMTIETVDASLEFFSRMTKKYGGKEERRKICLYGGEPLLNEAGVFHAVKKISEMKNNGKLPTDTRVYMISNGQLFHQGVAELFAKHGVSLCISLDGPKRINDKHRIAKSGASPFQKAKGAYEIAKKNGVDVTLSVTLTQEVIDNTDEVLDFFINEVGIKERISFNILHYIPGFPVTPEYYTKAAEFTLKASERFNALGIKEDSVEKKRNAFVEKAPLYTECGVGGGNLVIVPEGTIGSCIDLTKPRLSFSGSVHDKDFDPAKSGVYDPWRTRSPFFMESCVGCEALGICGGGCPVSTEFQTGSRWNIDPRICPHSKLTLEWLIWQTYDKNP